MLHGFRDFINRGNVVDLAVAVIIGAAFTKIISSLTDDLLMPVIGWLVGDLEFSNIPTPAEPADVALLREIRDELRKRNGDEAPLTSH